MTASRKRQKLQSQRPLSPIPDESDASSHDESKPRLSKR